MHAFGRTMIDGVCMQSTGYTCGAASLVTMLDRMGVEASEGEMARLTGTIPGRGVSDFQAADGLQRKLESIGRSERVRFVVRRDHDPESIPTPFAAGLTYSFWYDHMVCVLAIDAASVTIGDPIAGLQVLPREEFRERWRGVAITAVGPE